MGRSSEWEAAFKVRLGEILRQARRQRRISQEVLAERSEVSVNHISLIERGLTTPTLLLIFQLAAALDLSPTEIVRQVEQEVGQLTGRQEGSR